MGQHDDSNGTHQTELLILFRMFLLESCDNLWKLALTSDSQLYVALNVLKSNLSCFEQLVEIEVDLYKPNLLEKILEVSVVSLCFVNKNQSKI